MKLSQKLFYTFVGLVAILFFVSIYLGLSPHKKIDRNFSPVHSEFKSADSPQTVFVDAYGDSGGDNIPFFPMEFGLKFYVMYQGEAFMQRVDSCKNISVGFINPEDFKHDVPAGATLCDDKAYFPFFSNGNVIIYQQTLRDTKREISRIAIPSEITDMKEIRLNFPEEAESEINPLH